MFHIKIISKWKERLKTKNYKENQSFSLLAQLLDLFNELSPVLSNTFFG